MTARKLSIRDRVAVALSDALKNAPDAEFGHGGYNDGILAAAHQIGSIMGWNSAQLVRDVLVDAGIDPRFATEAS